MASHWYAIQSHPRKEEYLSHQIEIQGLEVFFPRIRVQPVNPRARKIRPYFPGYLFVSVDLDVVGMSYFQWMPYSIGLVSFGGEPSVVPDALIHAIRQRLAEIDAAGGELFEAVKHGDRVRIDDGPFAGYEAIFDARIEGSQRVRVLLKMLSQRTLPVEMEAGKIKPVKKDKT